MKLIAQLFDRAFQFLVDLLEKLFRKQQGVAWSSLTILPGIGLKNGQIFFEAGYKRPEDILSASDEELLALPGVGKNFLTRLRSLK